MFCLFLTFTVPHTLWYHLTITYIINWSNKELGIFCLFHPEQSWYLLHLHLSLGDPVPRSLLHWFQLKLTDYSHTTKQNGASSLCKHIQALKFNWFFWMTTLLKQSLEQLLSASFSLKWVSHCLGVNMWQVHVTSPSTVGFHANWSQCQRAAHGTFSLLLHPHSLSSEVTPT